ncbi:hypothetical protein TNCV_4808661 [Trichonephila clavipes]|nr:hypothetical protein TNCV_4808661 [Trichonephila clavipes]
MRTNCSSEPTTPAHILECLGYTKQDLADDPFLVLDFLKVCRITLCSVEFHACFTRCVDTGTVIVGCGWFWSCRPKISHTCSPLETEICSSRRLREEVGDIRRIQTRIASHDQNHLCSALGGGVHKSIGGNRPTIPQSFEMSSPAEEHQTSYEHQTGRHAPN